MDIFVILGIIACVFGLLVAIFNKNLIVDISDPNIGIVKLFGAVDEDTRLTPGRHFYLLNIGPVRFYEVVIIPGREEIIDIPIDNAYTNNVLVQFNVKLKFKIKRDEENKFPSLESGIAVYRSVRLRAGETLFSTKIGQTVIPGKIDEKLTSSVNNAITRVVMAYQPNEITSNQDLFDELLAAITTQVNLEISEWAQDLKVEVEDLKPPDEVARTKKILDAKAQAEATMSEGVAKLKLAEMYAEKFGPGIGAIVVTGQFFDKTNFTVYGDSVGRIAQNLSGLVNQPDFDPTKRQSSHAIRRIQRNAKRGRK